MSMSDPANASCEPKAMPPPLEALQTIFGTSRPPLDSVLQDSSPESVVANPRIAIIDDEPINVRVVRRMLTLAGYEQFHTTSDATQAMDLIRSSRPDVVLLDIMMPVLSGLDILRELRADATLVALPVVILTASTDRQTKMDALKLGATDFLNKPADSAELQARIRNVLTVKAHQDWLKRYAWDLELEVAVRTTELMHAHIELIECLAKVGEYRDSDTGNHVRRVGAYAAIVARHMGLSAERVERIRLAAPLHDIGKVGIPDAVLHKPGRLDEVEIDVMRRHSALGERLFDRCEDPGKPFLSHTLTGLDIAAKASSPLLQMAAAIAASHHERWDGTGYPQGLAGEAIPLEGRITAIADVFDALCSRRPYKPPFPLERSLTIIRQSCGTHFDPAVVDAFFAALDEILEACRQFADEDSPDLELENSRTAAVNSREIQPVLAEFSAGLPELNSAVS
ncbi:MAG: response regulator [Rhodopirellula sp.]|nr:response regulator [Rhodopirellula sp.]